MTRYYRRKEQGLCGLCGNKIIDTKFVVCVDCRLAQQISRANAKENGICTYCGCRPARCDNNKCERCIEKGKNDNKELRKRYKDENRCIRCGIPLSLLYNYDKLKCPNCCEEIFKNII